MAAAVAPAPAPADAEEKKTGETPTVLAPPNAAKPSSVAPTAAEKIEKAAVQSQLQRAYVSDIREKEGFEDDLLDFIKNPTNPYVAYAFVKFEETTKTPREHLVYAAGVLVALYLVFGNLAALLCNFIGFAYPSYASVKAIRTVAKDDDTLWLTYWTVFGAFSFVDFFAETILRWFPLYYLLKAVFLVYLHLPQTRAAATVLSLSLEVLSQLYKEVVDPLVSSLDVYYEGKTSNTVQHVA